MFAVSGQEELPYVAAKLRGKEVNFLFHTGSSLSVVSEHLVDKLGLHNNMLPSKVKIAIFASGNNIAFKHTVKCNFVGLLRRCDFPCKRYRPGSSGYGFVAPITLSSLLS